MLESWRSAGLAICRLAGLGALLLAPQIGAVDTRAEDTSPGQTLQGDLLSTRFAVGLERSVDYQVFTLTNPNRVIVELAAVRMQLPSPTGDKPVGLIKSFRGGLSAPGQFRIVIDVVAPVVVERQTIEPSPSGKGHRLVLDIIPAPSVTDDVPHSRPPLKMASYGLGAGSLQPPVPRPAERPEVRAAKSYKPVIVIDPGHGGHDSGAEKNGVVEKDVVLAFGKALRDKLATSGQYKVLMTRESDVFVPLDERRAFAENNQAALFIAVHADYARSQARGATIYSLRESVADALRRSAKSELPSNLMSRAELQALQRSGDAETVRRILADLIESEVDITKERTGVFTRSVIEYMGQSTNLKENPDRSAAFRVLKTAQVPAVLIELAYVSNAEDARLLKSDHWRDKVADSIMEAIENYFANQKAKPLANMLPE
ncbi:MAG TPA: N-acetylmuramoyl-L-alanine amidase [Hyphomicrobiaceae bacterium]|nr:N-acetylmuramoyl-L-alanine amidase [Hyphomicrobiaceae bacterium]